MITLDRLRAWAGELWFRTRKPFRIDAHYAHPLPYCNHHSASDWRSWEETHISYIAQWKVDRHQYRIRNLYSYMVSSIPPMKLPLLMQKNILSVSNKRNTHYPLLRFVYALYFFVTKDCSESTLKSVLSHQDLEMAVLILPAQDLLHFTHASKGHGLSEKMLSRCSLFADVYTSVRNDLIAQRHPAVHLYDGDVSAYLQHYADIHAAKELANHSLDVSDFLGITS